MNTDLMFSSEKDDWETPQDFFDALNAEFHFTVDVCANEQNHKCGHYYTKEQDGLSQEWDGVVWCNPPYGKEVYKWVEKASDSQANGATVVMLVAARTDTKWFHDYIYNHENVEVRFVKGRLKFGGSKNAAPFPSMVVVFRPKGKM